MIMMTHSAIDIQKAMVTREDALRAAAISPAARLDFTLEEYIRAATPTGARKIRGNVRIADVIAIPRCVFTPVAEVSRRGCGGAVLGAVRGGVLGGSFFGGCFFGVSVLGGSVLGVCALGVSVLGVSVLGGAALHQAESCAAR